MAVFLLSRQLGGKKSGQEYSDVDTAFKWHLPTAPGVLFYLEKDLIYSISKIAIYVVMLEYNLVNSVFFIKQKSRYLKVTQVLVIIICKSYRIF